MNNKNKQSGSALLFVLITAAVVMTIVLVHAYKHRVNTLSVSTMNKNILARDLATKFMTSTNISNLDNNDSFEQANSDYTVSINKNAQKLLAAKSKNNFFNPFELTNAEESYAETKGIAIREYKYKFSGDSITNSNYIVGVYGAAGAYNNKFYNQTEDLYPINIPAINTSTLLTEQLDSNGNLLEKEIGYVGAIEKLNAGTFKLYNSNNESTTFTVPSGGSIEDIAVGTELINGRWQVLLAVIHKDTRDTSNNKTISISSTSLYNLMNDISQAAKDLANYTSAEHKGDAISQIDNSATTVSADAETGTTFNIPSSSNFENLTWHNTNGNAKLFTLVTNDTNVMTRAVLNIESGIPTLRYASQYAKGSNMYVIVKQKPGELNTNDILIVSDEKGTGNRSFTAEGVNYGNVCLNSITKPTLGYDTTQDEYTLLAIQPNKAIVFIYDESATTSELALPEEQIKGTLNFVVTPVKVIIRYGYYFIVNPDRVLIYSRENLTNIAFEDMSDTSNVEIFYDYEKKQLYALADALADALECTVNSSCLTSNRKYFDEIDLSNPTDFSANKILYKTDSSILQD